jgi:hypothetical protein
VLLPRKIEQSKNDWFEYEFIGDLAGIHYKEEHDNVSDTDVKIMDREKSGIKQFSKLSDKEVYDILFGSKKMILSLIDLVILGVGDMGYWNMLLSHDGIPWVVDIEDTRPDKQNELGLEHNIFTRTSKANALVFEKGIKATKDLINEHLESRKNIDWNKYKPYWTYLKRDPLTTINYLLTK